MTSPLSPTDTRALLNELGHRPVKRLGQNFLIDGNIVRKSIELARIQPGDRVVEIGPGLGTLTQALLATGAVVHAIEKDPRLASHLKSLAQAFPDRLRIAIGDCLDSPLAGLDPQQGPYKIVANLPYAVSTPWMDSILSGPLPISLTLMLQKETALRFVARPGSKQFGSISIFLQSAFAATKTWDVSAVCFYPKPEVDSRLLHLEAKPSPFRFPKADRQLIRDLFKQRRKQAASLLKKSPLPQAARWLESFAELGIDFRSRPEQIAIDDWESLSRRSSAD